MQASDNGVAYPDFNEKETSYVMPYVPPEDEKKGEGEGDAPDGKGNTNQAKAAEGQKEADKLGDFTMPAVVG